MRCKYCAQEAVSYCDVTLGGIGWFLYHCAAHEPDELAALRSRVGELEKEEKSWRLTLRDLCEEWHEDCEESCDSYCHADNCRSTNLAAAKRAMREEIERLRTRNAELEAEIERHKNDLTRYRSAWDPILQSCGYRLERSTATIRQCGDHDDPE